MSRYNLFALGLVACLGIGVASLASSGPKQVPGTEALSSKTVLVLSKQGDEVATALKHPSIRTAGERHFLVGPAVDSPYNKTTFSGATIWIPLDDVTQLVELDKIKEDK